MLEKVFIAKAFTQCKTSRTLKTDVLEIPDNKSVENCFQNLNCFSPIKRNSSSDPPQILI